MNPLLLVRPEPRHSDRDDDALVAAVRAGDERAFEEIYGRYHRRIAAYVRGMVRDHGCAEDVTQEVFLCALRRMRQTDRPIAFRPWVYEIARNACIDHFRRRSRTDEVPFPPEDSGLSEQRLGLAEPAGPAATVANKQELELLRGAFAGLSASHHEIIVLRELEGLSYREIGHRMGLTRQGVESTLFRARRRLFQEYAELDSGRRCRRMQSILAETQDGLELTSRECRRLIRHLAWCAPCRRQAHHAGLTTQLGVERIRDRVAAWAPWPLLLALRAARPRASSGGGLPDSLPVGVAHAVPGLSEMLAGPVARLATAGAMAAGSVAAGLSAQPGGRPAVVHAPGPFGAPPGAVAIPVRAGGAVSGGSRSRPHVPAAPPRASASAKTSSVAGRSSRGSVKTGRRRGAGAAPAGRGADALDGRPASADQGGRGSTGSSGLPTVTLPSVALPALPLGTGAQSPGGSGASGSAPSAPILPALPPSVVPPVPSSLPSGNGAGDPGSGVAGEIVRRAGALLQR